jgi:dTMP kinase
MMSGRFISLEGGEGVGKSTQTVLLVEALEAQGLRVLRTREPGGSAGAEAIRTLLLSGAEERWSPQAEALLFAAARADHVRSVIQPALNDGQWVVCDRFLDSSRAYQGGAIGLGDDTILTLHGIGSNGFLPDRTLIFDMPDDQSMQRAMARDGHAGDRIGRRPQAFHQAVAVGFRAIAHAEPERCRLIDARGTPAEVHDLVMHQLADLIP